MPLTPSSISHANIEAALIVARRHDLLVLSVASYGEATILVEGGLLPAGAGDCTASVWTKSDRAREVRIHSGILDGVGVHAVEYRASPTVTT